MTIEKLVFVDKIEIVKSGAVQVRTATRMIENGKMIAQSFHRHVIAPGDDYSNEDARVQAICEATHTPEVVEAYRASLSPE